MSAENTTTIEQQAPAAVRSSDGLGGVVNIEGFGPAVKVAAVYDRSQPIKCPVCGHLGMRWGGWFTCDWTGKHIVELESGSVYVAVELPNHDSANPVRNNKPEVTNE